MEFDQKVTPFHLPRCFSAGIKEGSALYCTGFSRIGSAKAAVKMCFIQPHAKAAGQLEKMVTSRISAHQHNNRI